MDILGGIANEHIRKGTFTSATAHCFTAIFGSGILALPWSVAQVGWILGPILLIFFAIITLYTSVLLTDCYRSQSDPINGKRNRTYTDAVRSLLGRKNVICCGVVQYIMLWGTMIGYTITTVVSIGTLEKTVCFRTKGHNAACRVDATPYMLGFGAIQILLSQFPNLEEITIISVIATITSFIYATVALTLCIVKLYFDPQIRGNMMGAATVEGIALSTKTWKIFQALGNIAFAYQVSLLLLEIQVFAQAIFGIHERWVATMWPESIFNKTQKVCNGKVSFTLSKLVLRPAFVVLTTTVAMMLPFFNAILSLLGAFSFFPLTVYFPLTMYMTQAKIKRGSCEWMFLQSISLICLVVSLMAGTGAIADIIEKLHHVKLFRIEL
ncbi:hypothetical protein ACFE04_006517 [Oxalis oulophora]